MRIVLILLALSFSCFSSEHGQIKFLIDKKTVTLSENFRAKKKLEKSPLLLILHDENQSYEARFYERVARSTTMIGHLVARWHIKDLNDKTLMEKNKEFQKILEKYKSDSRVDNNRIFILAKGLSAQLINKQILEQINGIILVNPTCVEKFDIQYKDSFQNTTPLLVVASRDGSNCVIKDIYQLANQFPLNDVFTLDGDNDFKVKGARYYGNESVALLAIDNWLMLRM